MNAFEKWGIKHLSASSTNLFVAQPALWVPEKLMNRRGPVGCAAHRGTAAELGTVAGLLDPEMPIEECQKRGLQEFDRLTALSGDPRRESERKAVPAIIAAAVPELRQYGLPETQVKIEKTLPGVPVPWIGYIDLYYPEHAIVIDLKSQLRLSSEISTGHARQVSLYIHDTNHEGRICYATPQKVAVYRIENAKENIAALINIAKRIEAFLSVSDDPMVLASIVTPDFDSFYWSSPATRAMGREVYGF
jgi:hypothetical protein